MISDRFWIHPDQWLNPVYRELLTNKEASRGVGRRLNRHNSVSLPPGGGNSEAEIINSDIFYSAGHYDK